jgi:hypothetical protein
LEFWVGRDLADPLARRAEQAAGKAHGFVESLVFVLGALFVVTIAVAIANATATATAVAFVIAIDAVAVAVAIAVATTTAIHVVDIDDIVDIALGPAPLPFQLQRVVAAALTFGARTKGLKERTSARL